MGPGTTGGGRRRGAPVPAAALVACALAAGCGSDAREPAAAPRSTPAGYTPASGGQVTFARPSDWLEVKPPQGWVFAAESRKGASVDARAGVVGNVPQVHDADAVAAGSDAALRLTAVRFERGPKRALKVPGARAAVRIDYTYVNDSAAAEPALGTDVSLVYGTGKAVVVRINGRRDRLSPRTIDQIVATIAVVPGPAG
ncbi:hypothetical protein [Actinomadura sp. 21ATH]|uniref:hypothetical protein n=1 Tax=Actinomadura sp. 21ATH TaxID=1735444 RepID=UPI0035C0878E